MIRTIVFAAALLTALAVLVAAPTAALAAQPPASVAEMNALLGKLADYSGPHQAALAESSELIGYTMAGMDPIIAAGESAGDRKAAVRQVDAWAVDLRARIAALKAKRAALPPFPDAAVQRLLAFEPSMRKKADGYRQVKVECEKAIDISIAYAERAIPLTRAAAGGDDEALAELVVETFAGMKLSLSAENALLDVTVTNGSPDNPQTALARSIRASNAAVDLYLDHVMASLTGEKTDPNQTAAEMQRQLDISRAASREVASFAKAMEPEMRAIPDAATRARFLKILATFGDSSRAELEVADAMAQVAALVAKGASEDQLEAAAAGIEAPIQRRMQLQTDRLQLLRS